MGIRPRFLVLVGIDDAVRGDPRLKPIGRKKFDEIMYERALRREECYVQGGHDDFHYAQIGVPGRTLDLSQYLYHPLPGGESKIKSVVGFAVHFGQHDDSALRAMAAINPEKYLESGFERIPTLDPSKHRLLFRDGGYTAEDVAHNMFVDSVFENHASISRMQWRRAQHYLGLIGWTIPAVDLRYLLVWDWS